VFELFVVITLPPVRMHIFHSFQNRISIIQEAPTFQVTYQIVGQYIRATKILIM